MGDHIKVLQLFNSNLRLIVWLTCFTEEQPRLVLNRSLWRHWIMESQKPITSHPCQLWYLTTNHICFYILPIKEQIQMSSVISSASNWELIRNFHHSLKKSLRLPLNFSPRTLTLCHLVLYSLFPWEKDSDYLSNLFTSASYVEVRINPD